MNFFLDIDGTLLPFGSKSVPESGVLAIHKAQAEGHRVFLATGRSRAEVTPELYSVGFDGGVFAAGCSIMLGEEEVYRYVLTDDDKSFLFRYCQEHGMDIIYQAENGTWMNERTARHWHELLLRYLGTDVSVSGLRVAEELPEGTPLTKILYITEDRTFDGIQRELRPRFTVIPNTLGIPQDMLGEVGPGGITKATGIQRMIDYLGEDLRSTCAIGDGPNDIEMISFSHIGIAMGNALPEVKAVADFIAPDVDKDGLAAAIRYVLGKA